MNNNRDCEHGRQTGKCADCDLATLEHQLAEITAERDKLAAKLAKLDELATRFIEDSEEIAEFFEASGGRNHLVLAKDVRELADEMADLLNDQAVDNRHIDDIGNLNATAGNKLEALRDSIQACENQGYRVMFGNWQVTGAILSDSDGVIELVQE